MSRNAAKPKGKELENNKKIAYQEEFDILQNDKVRSIEELSIYDELFSGVLNSIRNDIRNGLSAEQILEKHASIAAARVVTVALTDQDSGKALAASKDILDRHLGKAKEKKEITHKLDKVDAQQIDSILLTELEALEITDYEDVSDEEN